MRIQDSTERISFSRKDEAVRRAVGQRQREATEEVERILAAAVTVMQRSAPAAPRVGDIVAEAGTSNKAFYRYFGGKDDLILAVMERGVGLVVSYLEHQMAKENEPAREVTRWIEGVLIQAADSELARASRAATAQFALLTDRQAVDEEVTRPLRELLIGPVTRAGSVEPRRDSDAVFETVFGTMRRHLARGSQPSSDDVKHLVAFCVNALSN